MKLAKIAALVAVAILPALAAEASLAPTVTRHRTHHSGPKAKGVDVSKWQGKIDFSKVAKAGMSFVVSRVSDGTKYHDAYFSANWSGTKSHGMVRGAYQFFRPGQDAVKQADYFLSKVPVLHAGDLPPILDVEVTDGVSSTKLGTQIKLWNKHVKAKLGLSPMIYTSPGFWNGKGLTFKECDLWVAHWGVSSPKIPHGWTTWTMWQYSDHGSVSGISGGVDMDEFNGTKADLHAYVGLK